MRRRSGCIGIFVCSCLIFYAASSIFINIFSTTQPIKEVSNVHRNIITKMRVFPQGGDSDTFNQPWPIPYRYGLSSRKELHALNKNLIFSNFTYSKGLGNLMFQLASLYAIATDNNAQLVIPQNNLLLRSFTLSDDIIVAEDSLVNEIIKEHNTDIDIHECCKYVNVKPHFTNGISVMLGYFQNKRFFHSKYENDIRRLYTFLPEVREQASNFLRNCMFEYAISTGEEVEGNPDDQHILVEDNPLDSDVNIVGVHIRHGIDIRLNSRNLAHGHVAAPIDYYKMAMMAAREQSTKIFFVICSDDIAWAKRTFRKSEYGTIFFCPGKWRETDMAILTMTDWVIQSTGTFSWWSAYLNDHRNQVIYYSGWPRSGSDMDRMINQSEYFLESWKSLS